MDSKQGIEKVAPVNAQAVGLLDPVLLQPHPNDTVTCPQDTTGSPPRRTADNPTGSLAGLEEFRRHEPYCLYVRVLRDSDTTLEQDRKVPEHCWNTGISKDICDLLSDTEFLVFKLPKTGWGMTTDKVTLFIDLI